MLLSTSPRKNEAWEETSMSALTEERDDVLREASFRGAAFAAEKIARRCGVRHSVRAVEMRARRIHCSLALQTVCPECGAAGVRINHQTGMCPLCTEKYHLEQERTFREQLERERAEIEASGELEATRRERDGLSNGDIICTLGIHESTYYR